MKWSKKEGGVARPRRSPRGIERVASLRQTCNKMAIASRHIGLQD
eukprot:CAMPEP_0202055110 /NCGR_PEP_ID=MMETSP0963-20130614/15174_1 /ASSEMBLY_ACC=CAM_ASM_000494 /TAXON_ID=4773 /ORGANISM="Schizochytrium aggregatum, Strain ATCC28209" /LENGTH=44 /DNA_ID= /DNA_START= /DNA_END= /DNA_ORIENTATION=